MTPQKSFQVVSIGDLVVDIIVRGSQFPIEPSAHQVVKQIALEPGGAGNFLIAGSHLGLSMSGLGVLGEDHFGSALLDILDKKNIDTTGVVCPKDSTTTTVVVLANESGKHVFLGKYGASSEISLSESWRASLRDADAVQGWGYTLREERLTKALLDGMAYAHQHGSLVFFDPGPQAAEAEPEHCQTALENSDVILLTEDEIPHLLPGAQKNESARELINFGPSLVCVKRGPDGCIIFTENQVIEHPGFPVQVCDTSAAGDSFDAAFIYAHLHGWPLPHIAAFANAMGAAKVKKFGTGRQVPTSGEVRQILKEFDVGLAY